MSDTDDRKPARKPDRNLSDDDELDYLDRALTIALPYQLPPFGLIVLYTLLHLWGGGNAMALSTKHKITLAAAVIAAAGAIAGALVSNSENGSTINQNGTGNNICAYNSQCNQGN